MLLASRCQQQIELPSESRTFATLIVQITDTFVSDNNFSGFDTTKILDETRLAAAFTYYFFARAYNLIDGNPIQIIFDELWKYLADEKVSEFINDKFKAVREQNGIVVGRTQSAKDVVNSPISHSIIEQFKTQIFFPNKKAKPGDYIVEEPIETRKFIIKKDNY